MAVITTSILPTCERFPFAGFVEPRSWDTDGARSQIVCTSRAATVGAPGVGNNQRVEITINLPANFSYAITDIDMAITAAPGVTYAMPLYTWFGLYDSESSATRTQDNVLQVDSNGVGNRSDGTNVYDYAVYSLQRPYKGLIKQSAGANNCQLIGTFYNTTANDGIYYVDLVARFLQFDINQMHDQKVNSNIPTR